MSQISAQYCDGLELRIKELQAENESLKQQMLAQQVVIEQMREALKAIAASSNAHSCHIMACDALTFQPDLSALREHDAEVVKKFAKWADSPSATMWAKHYIERIRKGEV